DSRSGSWRDEPHRRFVAAQKAREKRPEKARVRRRLDVTRQPRAQQLAQPGEVVARHLRKQVMLEVVVLVEQQEGNDPVAADAARREERILRLGQRMLRERAHRGDVADEASWN